MIEKKIPLVKQRDFELDARVESTPTFAALDKRTNSEVGNYSGSRPLLTQQGEKDVLN